ncbi:MAG: hypothetical protein ABSC06_21135 [Rhodopila sp.]
MAPIPDDPETLLPRGELSVALKEKGFKTSEKTLATKATRGGGPPYRSYGRTPLYRWGDALAWAQSRLSEVRGSTSEAETQAVGRWGTPGKNPVAATSNSITKLERRIEGAPKQRRGKSFAAVTAPAEDCT